MVSVEVKVENRETEGRPNLEYQSQRTLSARGHLLVVWAVIMLLLLIKWTSTSILTFNILHKPPLISLFVILVSAQLYFQLTTAILAEKTVVNYIDHNSSKVQYISIKQK